MKFTTSYHKGAVLLRFGIFTLHLSLHHVTHGMTGMSKQEDKKKEDKQIDNYVGDIC